MKIEEKFVVDVASPIFFSHRRAVREEVIEAGDPLLKPKYYISPGIEYGRMNRVSAEGMKGKGQARPGLPT